MMRSIRGKIFLLGLCGLPVANAWAFDDLDVTIRVIDRQEARMEGFINRIELPREAGAAARGGRDGPGQGAARFEAAREQARDRTSGRQQAAEARESRETMQETRDRGREWRDPPDDRRDALDTRRSR